MAYAYTGTVFAAPLSERSKKPSLFKRVLNAMIESRMRAAQREINAHIHLFGHRAPLSGHLPATAAECEAGLPFNR